MLIQLINANYNVKKKILLNDASETISAGDKIGIVGRNGCGKSTLLEILAGNITLISGVITKHPKAKIMLVKQELPSGDITVLDWLREADQDLVSLNAQLEAASEEEYGEILNQITEIEDARYEILAPNVLLGLGLSSDEMNGPMKNLSGGFCMRIAIAAALIQQPDLMLLDEPTNHLDLESSLWLVEFLKTYPKSYVIVSHYVDFLNQVTTKTWGLQSGVLTSRKGNYDIFVREIERKKVLDEKKNEAITKDQAHAQDFVDKLGASWRTAKSAQSRVKLIDRLESKRVTVVPEEKDINIVFQEAPLLDNPILKLKDVSAGYDEKVVLNDITLLLNHNSRIGLLGRNGQGKSTFLRLIADRLENKSESGTLTRRDGLRIGYFSQNQSDELKPELTAQEQLIARSALKKIPEVRAHLSRFGFDQRTSECKIEKLSGGEKSRLFFAIIAAQNPHLIILDEPTNHLDIVARKALITAINSYNGAIILVTHDWQLYESTMREYLLVNKGKIVTYPHSLEHYKTRVLNQIHTTMSSLNLHAGIAKPKAAETKTAETKAVAEKEVKLEEKKSVAKKEPKKDIAANKAMTASVANKNMFSRATPASKKMTAHKESYGKSFANK